MDSYKNFTGHIDVFYLNTGRFFHNGLKLKHILMDFKFCLLAGGHPPCSDHLIIYSRMCTALKSAIFMSAMVPSMENPIPIKYSNCNFSINT